MATTDPEPGALFQYGIPAEGAPMDSKEIANNFLALAENNYTSDTSLSGDSAFPKTKRKGQFRINASDPTNVRLQLALVLGGSLVWVTVLKYLQLGFSAPLLRIVLVNPGVNVWTIDHDLGQKPLVQVFDDVGFQFDTVGQAQLGTAISKLQVDPPVPAPSNNQTVFGTLFQPVDPDAVAMEINEAVYRRGAGYFTVTGPTNQVITWLNGPFNISTTDSIVFSYPVSRKQCMVQQVSDNRVVITHQAGTAPSGFVILVG